MSFLPRIPNLFSFRFNNWLLNRKKQKGFLGQDPWVIAFDDSYLLIQSADNDTKLIIQQFKDCLLTKKVSEKVVWVPPLGSDHGQMFWAPELHRFRQFPDKWYIYYAACDGDNRNHRMYVLESDTTDPLGSYHELGKITDKTDVWAIDLTVLVYKDQLFGIWSGWEGINDEFPQNLYIAEMQNPWTISGDRVCIARPEYEWEKSVAAINEGRRF